MTTAGYILTRFPMLVDDNNAYEIKCTSFVYIHKEHGVMLFDTGSALDRERYCSILQNKFGINRDEVKWVFTTHMHPDHIGTHLFYKKATIVYSRREYVMMENMAEVARQDEDMLTYLHHQFPGYRESINRFDAEHIKNSILKYWPHILGNNDPLWLEDNPGLPDCVTAWPSNGHTMHHYSYTVQTDNWDFHITGDALSTRFAFQEGQIITDNEPHMHYDKYQKTLQQCRRLKGIVVPGHDRPFFAESVSPVMSRRFNPLTMEKM
jgi:glyoxylase-like metal-dependent hydrolase (beta-lactamase superfamily II)